MFCPHPVLRVDILLCLMSLCPLFPVRVSCPRLSRTTEDQQSLWKNKRWSGQIWPCRACTKTHRVLEAKRLIWNWSVGQNHTGHTQKLVSDPHISPPSLILCVEGFLTCISKAEMIKNVFAWVLRCFFSSAKKCHICWITHSCDRSNSSQWVNNMN